MSANLNVQEFIEKAKASSASDESLVGILAARGWPEKQVYEALAAHYERVTGIEIPRRGGVGTAAKDAFFHLLVFSTLATWTIGLGALAFTLIDRWLSDALFSTLPYQRYDMETAAESIASVLVAFPIYLLISRAVLRDEKAQPEKLHSPVRKWLTYMALVIAACVFIGDLITALTYYLRGEITSRFYAKAFVVLLISGGVFFYYFGGLRRSEMAQAGGKWSRDRWMACISGLAVIVTLILGFSYVGAPSTQRALRADGRRVGDLYQLSSKIGDTWKANQKLPEHLDELPEIALADPVTRIAYEYHVKGTSQYELCATFAFSSSQNEVARSPDVWSHPQGHHCFALDATQMMEPYVYYP